MNDTFGKRFKSLRVEKGITQDELVKEFNEKYFYNFTHISSLSYFSISLVIQYLSVCATNNF